MKKPALEVTQDNHEEFLKAIAQFKKDKVLVGIPQDETTRESGDQVGNAMLLAISEFGSPVNNIPARHPMETGIKLAQDAIGKEYEKACKALLTPQANDKYLERSGIIAANSIKKVINSQIDMAPPAASTLAARRANGFAGTKALIVTAQMRNAITSVVKKGA